MIACLSVEKKSISCQKKIPPREFHFVLIVATVVVVVVAAPVAVVVKEKMASDKFE